MNFLHKLTLPIILMTFVLLVFSCTTIIKKSNERNDISYLITFDSDSLKVARVKVTFTPIDSILFMNPGANNLEKRWATFVHNIKVVDNTGKLIKVEELPDAKWKMHVSLTEKIVLSYDVHLDHEDYQWSGGIDGVAYSTDMGVFYTGRTLFIMNGEQSKNIKIEFKLPTDWIVTTPWKNEKEISNTYRAINNFDLANSMIFAGTHKEVSINREDFELVFALGSAEIIADETEFRNLAEGVLDYYIDLIGGIPKPAPDNPFKKAVVVISSGASTDGEALGNNISILIGKDGDPFSKMISRFIFAHEFFHLWNGKSFSQTSQKTEWFKEGVTNYYTLKALHHVKFLTDESYLDFLSNFFYKRYNEDNGVGKLSMSKGEEKHDHWGLIYGGGMLVGIAQDIIIRNATNNEKNIDDLMRSLYKKYGESNDNYTLDELQSMMSELSGIEQTDFFNSYILGTNRFPIDKYLIMAGLDAKLENGNLTISKKEQETQVQRGIIKGLFGQLNREK
jgi:predicted metalloprotease with PDZ domain